LPVRPYLEQAADWPAAGPHLMACHDADSIVVYQAYRPDIADFAVGHQRFGGPFSLGRMSWIKPGFLWMMHRSGWATKPDQERVLAVRLPRPAFDGILAAAVPASYDRARYSDPGAWRVALRTSDVRVQWDPDHDPHGRPQPRRAIQLGLRGVVLRRYAQQWPIEILDVSGFVAEQRELLRTQGVEALRTPVETSYPA
jgi:hypothetical protein